MTTPKPPRSVWVCIGEFSVWAIHRGNVKATRRSGYPVCRYDLHRPAKRKAKKARKR